jgi:hypothetical protein
MTDHPSVEFVYEFDETFQQERLFWYFYKGEDEQKKLSKETSLDDDKKKGIVNGLRIATHSSNGLMQISTEKEAKEKRVLLDWPDFGFDVFFSWRELWNHFRKFGYGKEITMSDVEDSEDDNEI